jgi:RNA polymerase sigma-70 factor (ECF subfamily)
MTSIAKVIQVASSGTPPGRRKVSLEEVQIIERLKDGDQMALETILGLYAGKLYPVAQRILGDAADSEEVIQDVFWAVYRKAKTFNGKSRLFTWLYRLTVNAALGHLRHRKRKRHVEYEENAAKFAKDGHRPMRPIVDWSSSLDEKYAAQEIHALVGKALDQLKPIDKSIVVLSDMEGLADKEIAGALELTVAAVKTRLYRARLFLRGKLAVQLGYSGRSRLTAQRNRLRFAGFGVAMSHSRAVRGELPQRELARWIN